MELQPPEQGQTLVASFGYHKFFLGKETVMGQGVKVGAPTNRSPLCIRSQKDKYVKIVVFFF